MKNKIGIFFLALIAIIGCHKEHSNEVTIQLSSPDPSVYYVGGDTIWFQGTATGESELHGMSIKLYNDDTDSLMYNYEITEHLMQYSFSTFYVNQVQQHTDVRMELSVIADHEGNEAKKTMILHLYP
jgi:hypothetical protein